MRFSLSARYALVPSVAFIARTASAASNTNGTWLYPDPQTTPTFNYLDTLNASWTSDFTTPWLHLWCGIINGNSSSPVLGQIYNQTAPATGSKEFPLNYALEPFDCHFELSREPAVGLGPPFVLSGTFNVAIESNAKPVTWSRNTGSPSTATTNTNTIPNSESTTSPALSNPESTTSPAPSKSTVETQASGSNGLSQGAKIGIGVGLALGVLALVAAAVAFYLLRRRKRARATPTQAYGNHLHAQDYAPNKHGRSEMSADSQVHEKDSAPLATHALELEAPRY